MNRRQRQSTAAPTPKRFGNEPPSYEKPAFPLNPAAQRTLAQLQQTHDVKKLDERLLEAQAALSNSAAEINDRLTAKTRATEKRRNEASSDNQEIRALEEELEALRNRVEGMTQRMDESMRKMIDGRHSVQAMKECLAHTATEARANASTQASTQILPSQRPGGRAAGSDAGEDEDNTGNDYEDFTPTDPAAGTQARPSPLETFKSRCDDANTRYQSFSFTQRYANDNDYRDFRRAIHDAKYPDGDVQIPHHSEWFKEKDAPAAGVTTRGRSEGNDEDDIALMKETISTRCPLTLMEFKVPLTSKKCQHSFESDAIRSMIQSSTRRVDNRANGERYVQCPVTGCSQTLTMADLHTDKVLLRKIKRLQRSKELAAEDMEMEDGGNQQSTLIDDDDDDAEDVGSRVVPKTQVKGEPRATEGTAPPPSTRVRGAATVVDLGSSTDEEEADEFDNMEE